MRRCWIVIAAEVAPRLRTTSSFHDLGDAPASLGLALESLVDIHLEKETHLGALLRDRPILRAVSRAPICKDCATQNRVRSGPSRVRQRRYGRNLARRSTFRARVSLDAACCDCRIQKRPPQSGKPFARARNARQSSQRAARASSRRGIELAPASGVSGIAWRGLWTS